MNPRKTQFIQAYDCRHITSFLHDNITPLKDNWNVTFYPCSAILRDGTFLPCVSVYSESEVARHYQRLIEQNPGYKRPLWNPTGTQVDVRYVKSVEKSRFALPAAVYEDFRKMGEVAMDSNQCMAHMKNGKELPLASNGVCAFFDFPAEYSGDDVVSVQQTRHDSRSPILGRFCFKLFVTWSE